MANTEAEALPYYRFSLDDRSLSCDFPSSGAALLRELGEELTMADQQDPANLVNHLLQQLNRQPCRLQIDSLERLLRGNEQKGWSEFCDPLWLDLLQKFLASTECPSQIILTSQDIPGDLDTTASRYPQFWYCETLQGLNADEQHTLFKNLGLTPTDEDGELLQSIGAFYDGHPLVLQVIADEICKHPFQGSIRQYWQQYEAKFSTTAPITSINLDRSRVFRRRVLQRVEQTIKRLPVPARQMICSSAVFRRPVPPSFWEAMVSEEDSKTAFDTLQDRNLVGYVKASDLFSTLHPSCLLIYQHNLIRSVALSLLHTDPLSRKSAHHHATQSWLTTSKRFNEKSNPEIIQGYLEAIYHCCEVEDWEFAGKILVEYTSFPGTSTLLDQLDSRGYYQDEIQICQQLLGKCCLGIELHCWNGIGNGYLALGNYLKAIEAYKKSLSIAQEIEKTSDSGRILGKLGIAHYRLAQYNLAIDLQQQSLTIAREAGDQEGECIALGNLGKAYSSLGQYKKALNLYRQSLKLSQEIGNRREEGNALGNIGAVSTRLDRYEYALGCHQQYLTIARETNDRRAEGDALAGMGSIHYILGQYEDATNLYQQYLAITKEIGDRAGEGRALGNLGNIYYRLGQYENASRLYQEHLRIGEEISYRLAQSVALGNLGNVHCQMGNYSEALSFQKQSLLIACEIGSKSAKAHAFLGIGRILLRKGKYLESLNILVKALKSFREIGEKSSESETFNELAELYHALGNIERAQKYCQRSLVIATQLKTPLLSKYEALKNKLENES